MNIHSFFSSNDLYSIQQAIASKAEFNIRRLCKGKENRYTITIDGSTIADDLAKDIWHGHNYLVGFQFDYHGKIGLGGKGWAVDTFPMFQDLESFKTYIDAKMTYPEYEAEEYGQMSFF